MLGTQRLADSTFVLQRREVWPTEGPWCFCSSDREPWEHWTLPGCSDRKGRAESRGVRLPDPGQSRADMETSFLAHFLHRAPGTGTQHHSSFCPECSTASPWPLSFPRSGTHRNSGTEACPPPLTLGGASRGRLGERSPRGNLSRTPSSRDPP